MQSPGGPRPDHSGKAVRSAGRLAGPPGTRSIGMDWPAAVCCGGSPHATGRPPSPRHRSWLRLIPQRGWDDGARSVDSHAAAAVLQANHVNIRRSKLDAPGGGRRQPHRTAVVMASRLRAPTPPGCSSLEGMAVQGLRWSAAQAMAGRPSHGIGICKQRLRTSCRRAGKQQAADDDAGADHRPAGRQDPDRKG